MTLFRIKLPLLLSLIFSLSSFVFIRRELRLPIHSQLSIALTSQLFVYIQLELALPAFAFEKLFASIIYPRLSQCNSIHRSS